MPSKLTVWYNTYRADVIWLSGWGRVGGGRDKWVKMSGFPVIQLLLRVEIDVKPYQLDLASTSTYQVRIQVVLGYAPPPLLAHPSKHITF